MHFFLSYLSIIIVLLSCENSKSTNQDNIRNDTIFINWNHSTLESLKSQIELAKDSSEKEIYINRMLSLKSYLEIDSQDQVNRNSIRYKFLNEIIANGNIKRDFFLIEANQSGELEETKNFVTYLDTTYAVDLYEFINRKWVKNAATIKLNLTLESKLKDYRVGFRTGFNRDDIIITMFRNNKIVSSEYYLYTTLSDKSGIKKILLLR